MGYILRIRVSGASSLSLPALRLSPKAPRSTRDSLISRKAAASLAHVLTQKHPGTTIDGPAPSFHPRERGKYSWQILVKSRSRKQLLSMISELPSGWSYDIDPNNLL